MEAWKHSLQQTLNGMWLGMGWKPEAPIVVSIWPLLGKPGPQCGDVEVVGPLRGGAYGR
jgi:hypothetical protein